MVVEKRTEKMAELRRPTFNTEFPEFRNFLFKGTSSRDICIL